MGTVSPVIALDIERQVINGLLCILAKTTKDLGLAKSEACVKDKIFVCFSRQCIRGIQ